MILAAAQQPPDAQFLLQFVLALSLLGNLGLMVLAFVNGRRTQKREVSFSGEFASKEAFDKHEEENKRAHEFLHKRISDGDHKLQAELKADISCVREDISQCRSELAAAARSNEHQNQALLRIEAKIDSRK
jgi:hypothetical protein